MSVRIRLRRVGRKKQPSYRIVVADARTPRDGAYVDAVGFYNPRYNPAELRLDLAKVDEWLRKGAQPSDTVASLIRKARRGGDAKVAFVQGDERPPVTAAVAETVAPAAAAAAAAPAEAEVEAPVAEEAAPAPAPEAALTPEAAPAPESEVPGPAAEAEEEEKEPQPAPQAKAGEAAPEAAAEDASEASEASEGETRPEGGAASTTEGADEEKSAG